MIGDCVELTNLLEEQLLCSLCDIDIFQRIEGLICKGIGLFRQ